MKVAFARRPYNTCVFCQLWLTVFWTFLKNEIIFNFVQFMARKKVPRTLRFFLPPLFLFLFHPGFGMEENHDPGSGIKIPDPQHCNL
jgi:hypothetical protein